jgi:hypothetical protein
MEGRNISHQREVSCNENNPPQKKKRLHVDTCLANLDLRKLAGVGIFGTVLVVGDDPPAEGVLDGEAALTMLAITGTGTCADDPEEVVVVVVEEDGGVLPTGGVEARPGAGATAGGADEGGDTAAGGADPPIMGGGGEAIMGEDIMGDMGGAIAEGGCIIDGGGIIGMEEGGGIGVAMVVAVAVGGTTTVVADMAIDDEAMAPAIAAPEPEEDMPMLFMYAVEEG